MFTQIILKTALEDRTNAHFADGEKKFGDIAWSYLSISTNPGLDLYWSLKRMDCRHVIQLWLSEENDEHRPAN